MSVKGQGHSLTLTKVTQVSKLDIAFFKKTVGLFVTNFYVETSGWVQWNKKLYKWSGLHDEMAYMPINGTNLSTLSCTEPIERWPQN